MHPDCFKLLVIMVSPDEKSLPCGVLVQNLAAHLLIYIFINVSTQFRPTVCCVCIIYIDILLYTLLSEEYIIFGSTGYGMIANPARGQLKTGNINISPHSVRRILPFTHRIPPAFRGGVENARKLYYYNYVFKETSERI